MNKLSIEELPLAGKKVVMRVDFNVPLDHEGRVMDATRIEASLPSIRHVLEQQGALILMSHLGRPNNMVRPELSLRPVAELLSSLLDRLVTLAPDCIGTQVKNLAANLKTGEILLLENLRFHRAEEHPEEDPTFAKELASYGDCYVNDAFGTAHRKHSSTYTIAGYFPQLAAAGFLMRKEIQYLGETLSKPKRPFMALMGGAKISSKIGVIRSLLSKADQLIIGGGMAYTFLKAQGHEIGSSLLEEEFLPLAASLLKEYGDKITLPSDCIIASSCSENASPKQVSIQDGIPEGFQGLDVGSETIKEIKKKLQRAETILWNGPFGVYEIDAFAEGTLKLAHLLSELDATTIVGGGDLIAAINKAGLIDHMTHVSTGGGATLEYIEYGTLPGIEALSNN